MDFDFVDLRAFQFGLDVWPPRLRGPELGAGLVIL